MRGRGRGGHGYHRPAKPYSNPRPPFDIYMVEEYFPHVAQPSEIESNLAQVGFIVLVLLILFLFFKKGNIKKKFRSYAFTGRTN